MSCDGMSWAEIRQRLLRSRGDAVACDALAHRLRRRAWKELGDRDAVDVVILDAIGPSIRCGWGSGGWGRP
jgi:hypothetical protein